MSLQCKIYNRYVKVWLTCLMAQVQDTPPASCHMSHTHTHTHTHTHIQTVGGGDICEVSQRMIINLSFMSDLAEPCRLLTASPWHSRPRSAKNLGFQLPESVDWFASWGQWKPLTVRVRLVSVYKSLCSLPSWQVEIWQTAVFGFKTFKECTIF